MSNTCTWALLRWLDDHTNLCWTTLLLLGNQGIFKGLYESHTNGSGISSDFGACRLIDGNACYCGKFRAEKMAGGSMITWNFLGTKCRDENGNVCSARYFGGKEKAEAALRSLVNCKRCTNCKDCTDCDGCEDCSNCTDCANCLACSNCVRCTSCEWTSNARYCHSAAAGDCTHNTAIAIQVDGDHLIVLAEDMDKTKTRVPIPMKDIAEMIDVWRNGDRK